MEVSTIYSKDQIIMNRCKQCGKEVPEGRKFCSSSCSAKYNNVRRVRKPWTEEQHQRNRHAPVKILKPKKKKRSQECVCPYCGKPSGLHRICNECKQYWKPGIYKKLNLQTGSLRDRYQKAFEILYEEYFINKLSVMSIYDKHKICCATLQDIFADHGLKLRTIGEGLQVGMMEGRVHRPEDRIADPKFRHGYHTTWEGVRVFYRSSYELKYAQYLDNQRIRYEMESKRIEYFDSQKDRTRVAIPDFYLPETNELVEIKGAWTYNEQNMKDKFKAYRDSGYKPILVLEGKQIEI